MIDLEPIVKSTDFWAALFGALTGALAAFLLEAARRWVADNTRRQAAINLALLSLAQMYTAMRNYHDQVFIAGRKALMKLNEGEPPVWAYQPAHGLTELQLRLNYEELGVLLKSHDPDLLHRVLAAERIYQGAHYQMLEHLRLHREFQHRLAEAREPTQFNAPPRPLEDVVGPDLYGQLTSIATSLRDKTASDMQQVLASANQLRVVARAHFPVRLFLGIDVVPSKDATRPPSQTKKPKLWRRFVYLCWTPFRGKRDRDRVPW
ncbi:MAG: hypothetical protein WD793_02575 [Steroidobacteraceae bacterium]